MIFHYIETKEIRSEYLDVENELSSKIWATKSLFYKNKYIKGQILSEDMICAKRPGNGIKCSNLKKYIGKKLKKNTSIRMIKKSDFK